MSAQKPFDWLGDRIAEKSGLSRAEARGMLRVVFRDVGMQPETVTAAQLKPIIARALAPALARVKVHAPEALCAALEKELQSAQLDTAHAEDASDVFSRLGRR